MIQQSKQNLSLTLGAAALGAGLVLAYWSLSASYPYFFLWDMDLVCAQDSLLINSGLLPDHIHHPGFGMYILLAWAHHLGAALNLVSVLNLKQLSASLNPLAPLAELIDFLRRLSPMVGLAMVLLLWSALRALLRPGLAAGLISLAVLGLMPGLFYQTAMVRTEAYALLFWSGAVLALVLAGRAGAWGRCLLVGLAGLLLGLTLLTKIQSGLYVAAAPLFYVMAAVIGAPQPERAWHRPGGGPALALGLALTGLTVVALLTWFALPEPIPSGIGAFADRYQVSLAGRTLLLMAGFVGLAGAILWGMLGRRQHPPWLGATALASWLGFGFVASLGLHFALYADPATAWQYLLLDFKMAFLRTGFGLGDIWSRLRLLAFCWPTVVLHLAGLAFLAWAARSRLNPGLSRLCLAVLAASLLAYASILTTDRFILRDLIWVELLLNLLALVCLLAVARFQSHSLPWRGTAMVLASLLLLANLAGAVRIPARLNANYNLYGWLPERSFGGVFGYNQRRFDQIFRQAYAEQASLAQVAWGPLGAQAADHASLRRAMAFVFPNLPLNLRQAGAALPGRPLWLALPEMRLKQVPPDLIGALVVDASAVAPRPQNFWDPALVRNQSESLDKEGARPLRPSLALLPRSDLAVYLFLEPAQWKRLSGPGLERLPLGRAPRLVAAGPGGEMTLLGLKITLYQELPLAALKNHYLFVIKNRLASWGAAP